MECIANSLFTPEMQVCPRLGLKCGQLIETLLPTPTPGPLPKLFSMLGMPSLSPPPPRPPHSPPVQILPSSRTSSNISGCTKPSLTTLARNNSSLLSTPIGLCVWFWPWKCSPFYFGSVFTLSFLYHSARPLSSGTMCQFLFEPSPHPGTSLCRADTW